MFSLPFNPLINTIAGRIYDAVKPEVIYPTATPYQQAKNSVPDLFVDQQVSHSTTRWAQILAASPSTYEHCRVVSLTWAKALASPLSHEFVQFIVEDERNGTRTRVFSDRIDKDEPDRVILGRDWSSANNPSDQKDMPMPLYSVTFDGNRPRVADFAALLAAVTARAPAYHLYNTMCWWYAKSVFDSAVARYGGQHRQWTFSRYAYTMVIWDYTVTPKYQMEDEARAFKKQNIEGMSYQIPSRSSDAPKPLSSEEYLAKVGTMLKNEEIQKEYEEALQVNGGEKVDPQLLRVAVQTVQDNAPELPAQTGEFKKAADTFIKTVLDEADAERNLEAFDAAWQKNQRVERNVPDDDDTKFIRMKEHYFGQPGQQEKQDFDRAMECFVGGVLRLLDENSTRP
ncbi:hypothetical protein E8E11_007542 [Didymella keratinophila]|nr:hypothetical protein E8E11_007542 [Didymella keratinophila]